MVHSVESVAHCLPLMSLHKIFPVAREMFKFGDYRFPKNLLLPFGPKPAVTSAR